MFDRPRKWTPFLFFQDGGDGGDGGDGTSSGGDAASAAGFGTSSDGSGMGTASYGGTVGGQASDAGYGMGYGSTGFGFGGDAAPAGTSTTGYGSYGSGLGADPSSSMGGLGNASPADAAAMGQTGSTASAYGESPTSAPGVSGFEAAVAQSMGYPAYGVGNSSPGYGGNSYFASMNPGQTLNALNYGVYGQESGFGTNKQAMSMRPNFAGAVGPMQITAPTAKQMAPAYNIYTKEGNFRAANSILSQLMAQYGGSAAKAAAAYNSGSPNPNSQALNAPGNPNSTVQNYTNSVLGYMGDYSHNLAQAQQSDNALTQALTGASPGVPGISQYAHALEGAAGVNAMNAVQQAGFQPSGHR